MANWQKETEENVARSTLEMRSAIESIPGIVRDIQEIARKLDIFTLFKESNIWYLKVRTKEGYKKVALSDL